MFSVTYKDGNAYLETTERLDLNKTLDCGQAFRWRTEDGIVWCGVAFGRELRIHQEKNCIILYDTDSDTFEQVWRRYFDLDYSYSSVSESIKSNQTLVKAARYGDGIRILNQEPWETLCSFIISQNNHIPRIKGIIERLCEGFGEKTGSSYSFPSTERIAALSIEDLAPLRCGFRAKYILDAAKKVSSGEVNLSALSSLGIDEARSQLMKICGVGPKVADCTLLFSLGYREAFPRDVWINRVMSEFFPDGLPTASLKNAGIVQQYLFYFARSGELEFKK